MQDIKTMDQFAGNLQGTKLQDMKNDGANLQGIKLVL